MVRPADAKTWRTPPARNVKRAPPAAEPAARTAPPTASSGSARNRSAKRSGRRCGTSARVELEQLNEDSELQTLVKAAIKSEPPTERGRGTDRPTRTPR